MDDAVVNLPAVYGPGYGGYDGAVSNRDLFYKLSEATMTTARISNQAITGLIVVVIGVLLLLETTDIASIGGVLRWIPSLFILFGLWRLVANGFRHVFGPVLIIAIAVFVQLLVLGVGIGNLWPLILIVIGLAILFGGQGFRGRERSEVSLDDIDAWSMWGDAKRRITSRSFRGGQATAFMGGVELDLRDAMVIEKPAVREATVLMGGLNLRVPAAWNVEFNTLTLLGGTDDKRGRPGIAADGLPDLVITGLVLMGGIEVKD
jgi:predicted membrane protein